jgi:hypothetical protein
MDVTRLRERRTRTSAGSRDSTAGLRLRPAGVPLQYDRYVAEPVTFYSPSDSSTNIGMLVFEMDADNKIAYQWVLPGPERPAPKRANAATPTPVSQLTSRPNLPSREITRLLEGRMAATNRGDGEAAAAFYAANGAMWR